MKRIVQWVPYALTQMLLFVIISYCIIKFGLSSEDGFFLGFLIASYGACTIWACDFRRWYRVRHMGKKP